MKENPPVIKPLWLIEYQAILRKKDLELCKVVGEEGKVVDNIT